MKDIDSCPLALAYPRRWLGYNHHPGAFNQRGIGDSLQSTAFRCFSAKMPNPRPQIRPGGIRDQVLKTMPIGEPFMIETFFDITESRVKIGQAINFLIGAGYPIYRIGKRLPAIYIYKPRNTLESQSQS